MGLAIQEFTVLYGTYKSDWWEYKYLSTQYELLSVLEEFNQRNDVFGIKVLTGKVNPTFDKKLGYTQIDGFNVGG